ncbi:large ribosomal subunit protein mL44 [Procambarus clarkii]|uniref:large ribosomal subunit protein mL44 n=1 Tax=Procambarus clarkii TaxID=6728 RepID=UPI001E671C48|nr:39S ribosomal protein L44, mitochondrial-like [Procambarus clarkii]
MSAAGRLIAASLVRYSTGIAIQRNICSTACSLGIKSRWVAPYRRELLKRQKIMVKKGLAPSSRRSEFIEWNYDAELFAFGKRLQEEFNGELLREALTDSSYIAQETVRQQALDVDVPALDMNSNKQLAAAGEKIILDYCTKYLRASLPLLPEEGIRALVEYLSSEEVMSDIGFGIGLKDLILCQEYPPSPQTLAKSFRAVVGALNASAGISRCQLFVRDFVASYLVGKDPSDIWQIESPMELLKDILVRSGYGEPEPRLMFKTGKNTIQAVYQVGVYSDKKLMGSGYGETVDTAVEQAAHDAVKKLFHIAEASNPLPFGKDADKIVLADQENTPLSEWSINKLHNIVNC